MILDPAGSFVKAIANVFDEVTGRGLSVQRENSQRENCSRRGDSRGGRSGRKQYGVRLGLQVKRCRRLPAMGKDKGMLPPEVTSPVYTK